MLRKTFEIDTPEAFMDLSAAAVADALAACLPEQYWIVRDRTIDSNAHAGDVHVVGHDAPPRILKAAIQYLDDLISASGNPELRAKADFVGLWNNGIACRYDRLNESLLQYVQDKLDAESSRVASEGSGS